jgi:hypothetical protein
MSFPKEKSMHEPRSVRRSPILVCALIFLSVWVEIAAQPAEAQQTVTLSGRVTDANGQAVSGATVGLEDPGWVGQETDASGNYRLSVPQGTYSLQVRPRHGPLISQRIERLTLSTNTIRNFVLETGVTLSGQVTANGQPVPYAWLWVENDAGQEISFNAANESGHYSLGVPVGTYTINVHHEDILDESIEEVEVTQATVLNFTLEAGVLLEGTVMDDAGRPVPDAQVCAHLPAEEWWEGFCTDSEPEGSFQLRVAPDARSIVVTVRPVAPLHTTRLRLEVSGEQVSDLVLTVSRDLTPFVPDDPPKAALISISPPTMAGEVTLSGAAGSVAPHSAVVAITLDTGHFTTAQATSSGSFTATLFAPAGTSILIKVDPVGTTIGEFLPAAGGESDRTLLSNGERGGDPGLLAALPGTILRVADPPGADIPIGGAGKTDWDRLPAWTFHGSINTQTLTHGDALRVRGTVRVDSSAVQGVDNLQVHTSLRLERLSDADGSSLLRHNSFASTFLTPTGLPIEREARFWDVGLGQGRDLPLVKTAATRAQAEVDLTLSLPSDLPDGYYRPVLGAYSPDMPRENPPDRSVTFSDDVGSPHAEAHLPIIRVGSPAPPRLNWPLLLDTLSNGSRGILAEEDADRFGIAQRILTSSETFVIPRFGAASDQPLAYRLEPFVPSVSRGNGFGLPIPPRIPFRFPSGSLAVTIRHPDGTTTALGAAPFVQSRSKSLVDDGGTVLSTGGGHLTDAYQLSTMDPRFEVTFAQDGLHVITMEGTIDDIWGNTWTGGGTYEVHVGRVLALDTAVLPGTHFEVGDGFNPGLVVSPPVTAEVEVRIQHVPHSDISQLQERVIRGRTNRFGYFQPAGNTVVFDQPGEYRVDITARGEDDQGQLWMGSRTWGGVVAPVDPLIVAHGRRGIDAQDTIGPQWFFFDDIPRNDISPHIPFPFQSGDVTWVEEAGEVASSLPVMSFHDPSRQLTALLKQRGQDEYGNLRVPFQPPGSFAERVVVGEAPLFSSRPDGIDPHIDPTKVDLWGYSYRSVQRPLVRVREEISEDAIQSPYWRFDDRYAEQIGVGQHGDLPGEFKFQYGAAVLHGSALDQAHYAIHGSLFVLLPEHDTDGTRTFPPFQGNGGGPSGGPLFTLKGEDIDLFIHLTGVRPGSVLETGNTFALVGAVGPTLPAKVAYTVTAPDGSRRTFSGQANEIGYYYEPADNFIVDQPGRYTVDLRVTYDGRTSAGQVTEPFPQGDVLGTARGRFSVYVVSPHSTPLAVNMPQHDFLTAPADFTVTATPPTGMRLTGGPMTALTPGVVLEDGSLTVENNGLTYDYDPVGLAVGVPILDVERNGQPVAADVVTVSLFGEGTDSAGQPSYAARVVTLHGAEFLNLTPVPLDPTAIRDLERLE